VNFVKHGAGLDMVSGKAYSDIYIYIYISPINMFLTYTYNRLHVYDRELKLD
jgi:hypothetical protein